MTDWQQEYETERARSQQLLTAGQHLFDEYTKAKRKADLLDAFLTAADHAGYTRKETKCTPTTSSTNSANTSTTNPTPNPTRNTTTNPTPKP